ncbi:MAG: hypothetical protein DRI61_12705, partial [Chloroflexi bacterium]
NWPTPTSGPPVTVTTRFEGVNADFSFSPVPVLRNRAVSFINLSRNATAYKWDFSDGTTSNAANPTHTYASVGSYMVVLTASNLCSTDVISQRLKVEDYNVVMEPEADALQGAPGEVVTYTLHITNTGTLSDVFRISVGSTAWATNLSPDTITLRVGEGSVAEAYVKVPEDADGGDSASVLVTARSLSDPRTPAASASVLLTTTAKSIYGVELGAPVITQTAQAGEVVTYTLLVTNTSNTVDTIVFTRTNPGWPTSFSTSSMKIARSGWRKFYVYITIPANAAPGEQDEAVIRATGSGGYDEVRLTTMVKAMFPYRVYLPLMLRSVSQ